MLKKLRNLPLLVYISLQDFISGLKKDERGLSGIVVAILLILVAVLAVILLWDLLGAWINTLWTNITGTAEGIN